jgi:hypothetical protein
MPQHPATRSPSQLLTNTFAGKLTQHITQACVANQCPLSLSQPNEFLPFPRFRGTEGGLATILNALFPFATSAVSARLGHSQAIIQHPTSDAIPKPNNFQYPAWRLLRRNHRAFYSKHLSSSQKQTLSPFATGGVVRS